MRRREATALRHVVFSHLPFCARPWFPTFHSVLAKHYRNIVSPDITRSLVHFNTPKSVTPPYLPSENCASERTLAALSYDLELSYENSAWKTYSFFLEERKGNRRVCGWNLCGQVWRRCLTNQFSRSVPIGTAVRNEKTLNCVPYIISQYTRSNVVMLRKVMSQ